MGFTLTIFGCFSCSQGSRCWEKGKRGGLGVKLRAWGSAASSREPTRLPWHARLPQSSAGVHTARHRSPGSTCAIANLIWGCSGAEVCCPLLPIPSHILQAQYGLREAGHQMENLSCSWVVQGSLFSEVRGHLLPSPWKVPYRPQLQIQGHQHQLQHRGHQHQPRIQEPQHQLQSQGHQRPAQQQQPLQRGGQWAGGRAGSSPGEVAAWGPNQP